MSRVPSFVVALPEFQEDLWIEKDDRLMEEFKNPFDEQNQIDWWKINVSIRTAFQQIEGEIKGLKNKKKKVSKRTLSWTRLAELAGCDRNTLKHPKRMKWTQEKFDFLSNIIENNNHCSDSTNSASQDEKDRLIAKLAEMREKEIKNRNELAKWIRKYQTLDAEYKTISSALQHKKFEVQTKERKIEELTEKLRKGQK
jgi:chromosome segregation ATPase